MPIYSISPEAVSKLTPEQYRVTQTNAAELPFTNEYWDNKEPGLYVGAVSGDPLFASFDKFDSGTGWPTFTRPLEAANVVENVDHSHGMTRSEVRSKHGDIHLSHVFPAGPRDNGGLRYCMNSAALKFIHRDQLETEGYGESQSSSQGRPDDGGDCRTRDPGGGCFWGIQQLVQPFPGVVSPRVGYSGGDVKNATYRNHGTHAEAIEITFDPSQTSFRDLLELFFQVHDPTTPNRQGNDRGASYRSAIFYTSKDGQSGDRALASWRFLGGRARTPGLPGSLSERLHLPLRSPAVEVAAAVPVKLWCAWSAMMCDASSVRAQAKRS
jgi:methionine-R-sulfoxide reductase/methionine-S-sulfoxide reductase